MKSSNVAPASKFCEVKTKGTLMLQQNEVSRAVENYGDMKIGGGFTPKYM